MPGFPGTLTDPITGEDLVEQEAAALARFQGRGLFSDDKTSVHGQLLSVLGTPLAVAREAGFRALLNACPTTAIETLSKWEDVFAMFRSPDRWDTAKRQERLANHISLTNGASRTELEALFDEVVRSPTTGASGLSWVCADANALLAGLNIFQWVVVLVDDCWAMTGDWATFRTANAIAPATLALYYARRVSPAHMEPMISNVATMGPPGP